MGSDHKKFCLHSLRSAAARAATNISMYDRQCKKHGRWGSENVKNNYDHEDGKSKILVSKNLGL